MTNKKQATRQLVAIMFTDIVGYTSLMQQDEKAAMLVRRKHREIFEESHKKNNGTIIQYYGDGTLSIFKSSIEAIQCAMEMQNTFQSGSPIVPIRVGLHVGDITYDATEVYGNGVNVASRIESMGIAGSILISARLNEDLHNHPEINTLSIGSFNFKNVKEPLEIFAVKGGNICVPPLQKTKVAKNLKSIAVLPFNNISTQEETEFFCDGITEEIINALAQIEQLKVTSRTSSFFFKGKNATIKDIGNQLNVSTLLEGSVRVAGTAIRITAQLIDVEEDAHFWSQTWDRKLDNIFEVQDEISLLIADKLREQFGHLDIGEHLASKSTENVTAYEYYLKGKFHVNKWNPEDVKQAISYYEKAINLDTNYADAYLGLADAYSFLGTTGFMPFEEAWGNTVKFNQQAFQLNPHSSGVHFQFSNQAFFLECDYEKSLIEMKKAIEINPNNADAHQFISFLYIIAGKKEEAKKHLEIVLNLNPLSQETHFFRAYFHYMISDYNTAMEMLNQCLNVNNKNIPAHAIKTLCMLKMGNYDEVIHYFDTIPSDVVIEGEKTGSLGLAYSLKNDNDKKEEFRAALLRQIPTPNGFTADSFLFLMYVVNGEHDKAFEWIEQALTNRSSLLLLRYSDPIAEGLQQDPRYWPYHRKIYGGQGEPAETKKTNTSALKDSVAALYLKKMEDFIDHESPYLNPTLSLRSLAEQVEISPNQLSWLLNERIGKNFNEFINQYRIEHFKKLAIDPSNNHISLIGLAYESGFNSKTVFNTFFKKVEGMTPREYLKLHA